MLTVDKANSRLGIVFKNPQGAVFSTVSPMCITSFTDTQYLVFGQDSVAFSTDVMPPGCGTSLNVRLFTEFSVMDSSGNKIVDEMMLMRENAEIVVTYAFSYQTFNFFVTDETYYQFNIKQTAATIATDPTWAANNMGMIFAANKFLRVP